MNKWDERMLDLAMHVSTWSKDPSTCVGSVVCRPDKTVASMGFNGFPPGVEDSDERLNDRPTKYALVVHAETNAIVTAREPLHGYSIYVYPFPPCSNCAGIIKRAGITRVVAPKPTKEQKERWGDSFKLMELVFGESNVELVLV